MKESEDQFRTMIDTIPTLAWSFRPDGAAEFLNQRWLDFTGLSLEQAVGTGWNVSIHSEDLARLMETWSRLLVSGEPGEVEARLRRFDGEYRWFLFRAVPVRNEQGKVIRWYGTSTDVENLKRAQEKLRQDETELRQIVDTVAQLVIFLRPDGSALHANRFTLEYTGLSFEDLKAKDFRERVFHPDDVERLREERQKALLRGIPFENEQRARRKDGQYRWFFIRYNALPDEQGNPVRWYAAGIDIEDRKRAEERVRNENLALREEIDRTSMFEEIVGSSDALRTVLTQVSRVAPTDTTVLILGETGTGKELIARAIHKRSGRSARAFIRVNCLTNIHRHSGGASAQVRLLRLPGEVKLEVVDDGRGINEETLSDIASGTTAGVGLRGMRERVRQLGGNVEVRSNGKGTTVIARLPFIESPTDRDEPVSDPADNRVPARM